MCPCGVLWSLQAGARQGLCLCMRQVIILRKDVDYTLHGMADDDGMDLD